MNILGQINFQYIDFLKAQYFIEQNLEFPKAIPIPKGRCAFAMFKLGRHGWHCYKDYEEYNTLDLWYTFEGGNDVQIGVKLPDVWKKANGSWNIVYGKPCY